MKLYIIIIIQHIQGPGELFTLFTATPERFQFVTTSLHGERKAEANTAADIQDACLLDTAATPLQLFIHHGDLHKGDLHKGDLHQGDLQQGDLHQGDLQQE